MKYIVSGVIVLALGLELQAQQREPLPSTAIAAQSTTLEGCLKKGMADGEFALSAAGTDYVVVPSDGVNLAAHVNHQIQVTGAVEKGGRIFKASAVKMVATTCSAS